MEMITAISPIPFKINGSVADPSNINYNIIGLQKKRTIVIGELRKVDYYESYDYTGNTYNNLILTEYRHYVRNEIGIIQYRNMSIDWYCEDDSIGMNKSEFIKYYSPEEAIQEGVDRRNNMISSAKTVLLNGLKPVFGEPTNQMYAFDLLLSIKTQMDYFSQGYTQPLRDAISASTKAYMQIPGLKGAIIEQLTF